MEILKPEDLEAYGRFVQSHPKGHFMQSPEWAKVKNGWKWEAVCEKDGQGHIIGGLSVLIRRVPGLPYAFMYAPRGPVCDLSDANMLAKLIGGARALAVKNRAYLIKIDPDVPAGNTAFARQLAHLGFTLRDAGENFEGIQPRFVFRLDLSGKTEEQVMAGFHSKTRYNIRLAVRHGIEVKVRGREALNEFMPIMRETGKRDGFATRPKAYFERLLSAFQENARLYMAYFQGIPVAGAIAVSYGDKTWYLYGASSNRCRNMMPNYLLQWEMIRWAIERGCRIYDFRGVSGDLSEDNPLYGLYRFKKGFGGEFTEFAGEFDLVLNRPAAMLAEEGFKIIKGLRHLTNRRQAAKREV